jgi:hypothetical protein
MPLSNVYAVASTRAVAGVSSVVGPIVTSVLTLALVCSVAGTSAVASVSSVACYWPYCSCPLSLLLLAPMLL